MKEINNQKGFTGMDILISIGIIALFTGIIATISYNIYLANASSKRISTVNSYIVEIYEQLDRMPYDDVAGTTLEDYFNGKHNNSDEAQAKIVAGIDKETAMNSAWAGNSNVPYKIKIYLEKLPTGGYPLDLVTKVWLRITYKLGGKQQTVDIWRIKEREEVSPINKPDIKGLSELYSTQVVKPLKYLGNDEWEVCNENNSTWYNYNNGYWATVIILNVSDDGEDLTVGTKITGTEISGRGVLRFWEPRHAYKTTNPNKGAVFLYQDTDKYVKRVQEKQIFTDFVDIDPGYNNSGGQLGIWKDKAGAQGSTLGSNAKYAIKNI